MRRFAILAAVAAVAAGCGSPKRDECRALMNVVNVTADRVEKAQASSMDPNGLRALADGVDKSVADVTALRFTIPDLDKQAKAYAALWRDIAKPSREMAAAGEARDRPKAEAAGDAMEKLVAQEPKLQGDLNRVCQQE